MSLYLLNLTFYFVYFHVSNINSRVPLICRLADTVLIKISKKYRKVYF